MAEDLDSELLAHQEEEERRQAEELERLQQEENRRRAREIAMRAARKAVERSVEKKVAEAAVAEGAAAAGAAASAIAAAAVPILTVLLIIFVIILLVFVIIAVICYPTSFVQRMSSWGLQISGIIPQDICQSITSLSGIATTIEKGIGAMCAAPRTLAQQYLTPYPAQDDPDLANLVTCITNQVGLNNVGNIATFEETNAICNYTRGLDILESSCGQCVHTQYSCHYGGTNGSTGAKAVDFGGMPGAGNEGTIGPQILQSAQICRQSLGLAQFKRATCENTSGVAVACSNAGADHVHISLGTCDTDNGPVNNQ